MRDVTGITRDVGNSPAVRQPNVIPQNTSTMPSEPTTRTGLVSRLVTWPKGLGKFHGVGSMIGGAVDGFITDTEQYRQRFGMQTDNPSFLGDLGVRTLGVLSDVGNTATFGLAGRNFADKQQAAAGQNLASQQARFATHNASKAAQPVSTPSVPAQPKQPSFNDQVNNELYGTASATQPVQAALKILILMQFSKKAIALVIPILRQQTRHVQLVYRNYRPVDLPAVFAVPMIQMVCVTLWPIPVKWDQVNNRFKLH